MNLNRFLYARAKVGINLHLEDQIVWANELNERTYTLAACGVPQLVDNPKLLRARFSDGAMFQANSPKEYFDLFQHMLDSPKDAQAKAAVALEEVYAKHTTFHRAEMFITQLSENLVK
jgi:spore maturation protein CgeB